MVAPYFVVLLLCGFFDKGSAPLVTPEKAGPSYKIRRWGTRRQSTAPLSYSLGSSGWPAVGSFSGARTRRRRSTTSRRPPSKLCTPIYIFWYLQRPLCHLVTLHTRAQLHPRSARERFRAQCLGADEAGAVQVEGSSFEGRIEYGSRRQSKHLRNKHE